jgi:Protein similar to CwfJ C-terminus 1
LTGIAEDYKRTQHALATCLFCLGEDDSPPKAPVIAMGTCVYLSRTLREELVEGHCLIVPMQHYLNMLEADDNAWDEVRVCTMFHCHQNKSLIYTQNFMKSLMHMNAKQAKGIVFYETVTSFKQQKHTYIECVPLPWTQYDDLPIYFKACAYLCNLVNYTYGPHARRQFHNQKGSGLSTES